MANRLVLKRSTGAAEKPKGSVTIKRSAKAASGQTNGVTDGTSDRARFGGDGSTRPVGGGNGLWGITKSMQVRFLSEPEPTNDCPRNAAMWWFQQAWWSEKGGSRGKILLPGETPPAGSRVSTKNVAAIYDRADTKERIKYLQLPQTVMDAIKKQFERYGSVCDVDAFIDVEGTGMQKRYTLSFDRTTDPIPAAQLRKIRASLAVGEAIADEAERLENYKPAQKTFTRTELMEMDIVDFKALAKSYELPLGGRKRGEIASDIIAAQAAQ